MSETVTYFGHSACLFSLGDSHIGVDLWLNDNPHCKESPTTINALDALILTHGHSDHAGDAVELANKFKCKVFATYELAQILISEGVPASQVMGMNKGGEVTFRDCRVSLTNAFHSSSYQKKNGTSVYAGEACGVVVSSSECTIYHAGDTCLFRDMELICTRYRPSLSFLPIGDVFTMGPEDAALAGTFLGSKLVAPLHFGTFPPLTGTVEAFKKECQKHSLECFTPSIGVPTLLPSS